MILCITGTNPYDFSRLIKAVDQIANDLNIETHIQTGNSDYIPKYSNFFKFKEMAELKELMSRAELVISQGGCGTILDSFSMNKKLICVPRLIKLNECTDDQVEIVKYYEEKKYINACYDVFFLKEIVTECLEGKRNTLQYQVNSKIVLIKDIIREFISN